MTKNNKNSFVVAMNNPGSRTDSFYKEQLLRDARALGLTISGEDYPAVRSGIDLANTGNIISVGTSDQFDVDWIRRPGFVCERGLKPVYNIVEDWNTIQKSLVKYAEEKYGMPLYNGKKVTFHKGFVKVGTDLIYNDEIAQICVRLR